MSFDCAELEQYPETDVCVKFVGGQSKMVVVKYGVTVNTTSESSVQDAITAGNAALIDNVIIGIAKPSPITAAPNIPCQTDDVTNYDRAGIMRDGKVTQPVKEFFDSLNNVSGFIAGTAIIFSCSENRQYTITGVIKFTGGIVAPENDNEYMVFDYDFAWRSKTDMEIEAVNPIFA